MRHFLFAGFALTALVACGDPVEPAADAYELVGYGRRNPHFEPPFAGSLKLNETGTYALSLIWSRIGLRPDTMSGSGTWSIDQEDELTLSPPGPYWCPLEGTFEPDTVTIVLNYLDCCGCTSPDCCTDLLFARR